MKTRFICVFAAAVLFVSAVAAQEHPTVGMFPEAVFDAVEAGEAYAAVKVAAPGYTWAKSRWRPPLVVLLNGKKRASLIPIRGGEAAEYKVFLGPVGAGRHTVSVADPSKKEGRVVVESVSAGILYPRDDGYERISRAPVLLGRQDNESSDAPLMMWTVESATASGIALEYTVLFSNEDGGTKTAELMARYGRTVDIEYVYRVAFDADGRLVSETFQGPNHEELPFNGRKIGEHPVLRVCTFNNMVCDDGDSPFVFMNYPVEFDADGVRERMLDREPWINRVAFEELTREGKLTKSTPDPERMKIDDPRLYALVDIEADVPPGGPGIEISLKAAGGGEWRSASQGVDEMRFKGAGKARLGVLMPEGCSPEDIEAVRLEAVGVPGSRATILSLGPITFLDADFRPSHKEIIWKKKRALVAGSAPAIIKISE
ncbi:MAG: hypothetical protein BWY28_02368 [bacterium ADurb.Bin236]|nr:MAG: hypothetical protein BWY28_02368 [bacterium ADurb.Bin236]HOY62494.1 hypothetical protein [bacterium]HPN95202.1 hypothetical protein [bacterium]